MDIKKKKPYEPASEKIEVYYGGESFIVQTKMTKEQFCGYRNLCPNFMVDIANAARSACVFITHLRIFTSEEGERAE